MITLLRIKNIKTNLLLTPLIVALCLMMTSNAIATPTGNSNSAQLDVTPKRCIALRKGQKCYLEVTFQWQHPQISNYCLINKTTNKSLKCWSNQSAGNFSFDFQSTESNDFTLRNQNSTTDLANARIALAWVYKSSKRAKSTWRLF